MRIDGLPPGMPPLRLTGVTELRGASATGPKSQPRIADGDTVSFEAVYISTLPRVPLTEAHRRLEQIREQLVAGRTAVPIHFSDPCIVRSGNPYAWDLKFAANPADRHNAATEQRVASGVARGS
jgi:hypothetical protein